MLPGSFTLWGERDGGVGQERQKPGCGGPGATAGAGREGEGGGSASACSLGETHPAPPPPGHAGSYLWAQHTTATRTGAEKIPKILPLPKPHIPPLHAPFAQQQQQPPPRSGCPGCCWGRGGGDSPRSPPTRPPLPKKKIPHPLPQHHHPARGSRPRTRLRCPAAGRRRAPEEAALRRSPASRLPSARRRPPRRLPASREGRGRREGAAVPPGGEPEVGRRGSGAGGAGTGTGSEGRWLPGHRLGARPTRHGTGPAVPPGDGHGHRQPRGVSPQPAPSPRGRSGTAGLGQPAGYPLEPGEQGPPDAVPLSAPAPRPAPLFWGLCPPALWRILGAVPGVSRRGGRGSWPESPAVTCKGLKLSLPGQGCGVHVQVPGLRLPQPCLRGCQVHWPRWTCSARQELCWAQNVCSQACHTGQE